MQWLSAFAGRKTEQTTSNNGNLVVVMIALVVGLLLLVIDSVSCQARDPVDSVPVSAPAALPEATGDDLSWWQRELSRQCEEILSTLTGAGTVKVWVSLGRGPQDEPVYDQDVHEVMTEEADASGGSRTVTETKTVSRVIARESSGGGLVWRSRTMPEVTSVVVVASGARDAGVRRMLAEAVTTLFGLPAHRVVVLPGGGTYDGD